MFEKRWAAVPPQAFTSDGTANGKLTVADSSLFKVKQQVVITANALTNLNLQINRIDDIHTIYVGPTNSNIIARFDLTGYTVAEDSAIYAIEQPRSSVPEEQIERLTYEEEPTVARRVILVDEMGDKVNSSNPLPVDAVVTIPSELAVRITAEDDDPNLGDIHSSVRIGDGTNEVKVNSDGSLNVNVTSSPSASPGLELDYNEITSVPSGVETTLFTKVISGSGYKVYKVDLAGENIALYKVYVDNEAVSAKRTFFGNLNETISYEPFDNGMELNSGQTLKITVLHTRSNLASFEVTVMGLNL